MDRKLAKDRKYYVVDMQRPKRYQPTSALDTLDSYIANIANTHKFSHSKTTVESLPRDSIRRKNMKWR
jgi:hypothetical protein